MQSTCKKSYLKTKDNYAFNFNDEDVKCCFERETPDCYHYYDVEWCSVIGFAVILMQSQFDACTNQGRFDTHIKLI